MLGHDNLQWYISLTLCLLCTNGVIASVIKPDILVALDGIAGFDLNDGDMSKYHIWPQGIIYYYIDDFSFDKVLRDRIRSYLDQISTSTGLQFMEIPQPPKDDDSRWVFFLNRQAQLECGDVAYQNFTSQGVQKVVVGYDCVKSEDLAEVILSLVGVPPQHNSPDRDDYITVNFDNILPDKHYLFQKMRPEDWMYDKFEYDFASAGHYNTHKHTLNGAETISPKNRETYKEGNNDLSAVDIKKIRTTYNYISLKGKNKIKVPECNKLFVTGSNFSDYIPATKSDKQVTKSAPNHSDDVLPDNTKNNMSEKVNSNEASKPKDSKDNIEDESDNKELAKNEYTKNLNDETEHEMKPKTKLNEKKFLSEKKLSLLKHIGKKNHGNKDVEKLLNKSDYSTSDEGRNKYLKGKEKKLESPDIKTHNENMFLSGKKKSLLKGSGNEKGGKTKKAKKILYKSDNSKGDEGHNKLLNGKEEQSDSPDTPKLNKGKNFISEKKKTLLKYNGKNKRGKKDIKEKLLLLSDYSTGDDDNNKYLNKREEKNNPHDTQTHNKEKTYISEKKITLLKNSGKGGKMKYREKLLLQSDYSTGDDDNNKYLNKREEKSNSPDTQTLNKGKKNIAEKKEILLKNSGKRGKKRYKEKLLLQSDFSSSDEGYNNYLNEKQRTHFI